MLPSHLVSLASLGIETALVVDVGYSEAVVLPVCHGFLALHAWQALPLGAQAIHRFVYSEANYSKDTTCFSLETQFIRCSNFSKTSIKFV